ncbi:hypothetical protein LZ31DRAFT_313081 [Colletotrichum somersetense]|nr:hypothetical protein LZ31DRAFT_313081 [Colletotrichum somersetense]
MGGESRKAGEVECEEWEGRFELSRPASGGTKTGRQTDGGGGWREGEWERVRDREKDRKRIEEAKKTNKKTISLYNTALVVALLAWAIQRPLARLVLRMYGFHGLGNWYQLGALAAPRQTTSSLAKFGCS